MTSSYRRALGLLNIINPRMQYVCKLKQTSMKWSNMSDILTKVIRSYHHDVLSPSQAEERLRSFNTEGAYLLRESNVKTGIFVLSLLKASSVIHIAVPNKNGKFSRQTFEEACEVVDDIIHHWKPQEESNGANFCVKASTSWKIYTIKWFVMNSTMYLCLLPFLKGLKIFSTSMNSNALKEITVFEWNILHV